MFMCLCKNWHKISKLLHLSVIEFYLTVNRLLATNSTFSLLYFSFSNRIWLKATEILCNLFLFTWLVRFNCYNWSTLSKLCLLYYLSLVEARAEEITMLKKYEGDHLFALPSLVIIYIFMWEMKQVHRDNYYFYKMTTVITPSTPIITVIYRSGSVISQ